MLPLVPSEVKYVFLLTTKVVKMHSIFLYNGGWYKYVIQICKRPKATFFLQICNFLWVIIGTCYSHDKIGILNTNLSEMSQIYISIHYFFDTQNGDAQNIFLFVHPKTPLHVYSSLSVSKILTTSGTYATFCFLCAFRTRTDGFFRKMPFCT